jgi:hypothetical protein
MADLALLSLFAGLYSVPMYALIQLRAQPTHRARIIAANNILNALFMIASSVIAGVLLKMRASPSRRCSCWWAWPMRWWRSTSSCWCPSTCCASWPGCVALVYRFKVQGDEHIPVRARPCWCATT